jgi:hypothetical protein
LKSSCCYLLARKISGPLQQDVPLGFVFFAEFAQSEQGLLQFQVNPPGPKAFLDRFPGHVSSAGRAGRRSSGVQRLPPSLPVDCLSRLRKQVVS